MISCGLDVTAEYLPLSSFLRAAAKADLHTVVGQLSLFVSSVLVDSFSDQARSKIAKKAPPRPIIFEARGWAEFLDYGGLDHKLAQYVLNSVDESSKHDTFCISVDKATPGRITLSNGAIVYPNNVGVLCCPTVCFFFIDGRCFRKWGHHRKGISGVNPLMP